jgi:transcriptional antiterminator RfaH
MEWTSNTGDGLKLPAPSEPLVAWFCLRSQPKHEHIAAQHLRCMDDVQVLNPRVRFKRATRLGKVWVTEAMFPSYLFARFDFNSALARVNYAPGVKSVVHFGTGYPFIPDPVIDELRATLGDNELRVIADDIEPGDAVKLLGEPFHGLHAVVTRIMPGRQRVLVLLDFLGRQTPVEVGMETVIKAQLGR